MSPGHSTPSGFYEGVRGGIPTLSPERRRILNSLSEQVGQRDMLNNEIPRYDDYTESVASFSSFADLANVALPAENHDTHADSTMPFTREPSENLLNIIADLDRDGTQYQLADFNFKHDSLLAYRFDVNHPDTEAHSSSFTPTPATLDRLLSPQSDQDPEHIGQPIGPRKEWVVPPRVRTYMAIPDHLHLCLPLECTQLDSRRLLVAANPRPVCPALSRRKPTQILRR
ncbi:hypothetical protein F4821DRAFT_96007 [Hypoxylon rubiginosum]|uniref:Uncharacterized protein n=1 Tax=Hypoxylon rubiginosum TaxID=110542 RepID=A0ACC0D643_9PEZI|nr:hypothetical protein F4821DRAFT_96007 [Hypoxylon rubiginosum]